MITLIAKWTIGIGHEEVAMAALRTLAHDVFENEEGTWVYLCHAPDAGQESLPTAYPYEVIFFEVYKDKAAYEAHVDGPIFTAFLQQHSNLFVTTEGKPFVLKEFLTRHAGFVRGAGVVQ